jgi:hypothetical protein
MLREEDKMFPKPYQQGWIHGLPGFESPGGIPVEVVEYAPPKPGKENWFMALLRLLGFKLKAPLSATDFNFTILAAPEVRAALRKLADEKTTIPKMSFVVRTEMAKEMDDEYQMGEVTFNSALPAIDPSDATVVNAQFERITARLGVNLNPGPPVGAFEVQSTGMNTGWVFTQKSNNPEKGRPMDVVDFVAPNHNGKLLIKLGKPCAVLEKLSRSQSCMPELILVLPERTGKRYVEFKLRDVRLVNIGEGKVAFESSFIEWLTG